MSASFSVQPVARFAGPSEPVKRPKVRTHIISRSTQFQLYLGPVLTIGLLEQEFACFSYDDKHEFHLDDSSLRYYYPPLTGADLSRGFEDFVKQDDSQDEHLDSLLRTIIGHEQETKQKIDSQIITWRGVMTKVCTSHHANSLSDGTYIYGGRSCQLLLTTATGMMLPTCSCYARLTDNGAVVTS